MKPLHMLLIVACFCVVFAQFSGVVSALDENDAAVTVSLSSQTTYRGGMLGARMLFESRCPEQILIGYIGLNFGWMDLDDFVGQDLSEDPEVLSGYGSFLSDVVYISVPENASIGKHNYFVGVEGIQGESAGFSWDSELFTVMVYGSAEEAYTALSADVSGNITAASGYRSSEARSLLAQAQSAYDEAVTLADEENFAEAISRLETASDYLEDADAEEQNYDPSEEIQNLLLVIVAVAVVAVVVAVLLVRRKRKKTARRKRK
jgi:hypothetical protein